MNKKNLLLLAAGLVAIAVLTAVYFFVSDGGNEPAPDADGDLAAGEKTPDDGESRVGEAVFDVAGEADVSRLTVFHNGEKMYSVFRDSATDELLIEGYEWFVYTDAFKKIVPTAAELEITETIDDPLPDTDYGIAGDLSPYALELVSTDGKTETLYIGAQLLSGEGYYGKMASGGETFAVEDDVEDLFCDVYSLLTALLANPLESSRYHYTQAFSLYRDMEKLLEVRFVPDEEREAGDAYGYYKMIYPGEYNMSDTNYDATLKALITPLADIIVTTDLSDENLRQYGFYDDEMQPSPSYEIHYALDGEERVIYFGKRTDDGLIYTLSVEYGFIGLVGIESRFPFLDWELIDFINPYLFGMNINYVKRVSVSGRGFTSVYELEGTGEELTVTETGSGKTIDTQNFRNFYRVLLMTHMDGGTEEKPTDDWMLTFTVETRAGKIYEYKFFRLSTRKCYYTVNGTGDFYVSVDVVEKILSDAGKLLEGTPINAEAQY